MEAHQFYPDGFGDPGPLLETAQQDDASVPVMWAGDAAEGIAALLTYHAVAAPARPFLAGATARGRAVRRTLRATTAARLSRSRTARRWNLPGG